MLQKLKDYKTNTKIISNLFIYEKKVLHLCGMGYLQEQEIAKIKDDGGKEIYISVRPDNDDPLVFRLFNSFPGYFYIREEVRPAGYINPDDLPDNESPYYQGRILFDENENWIYDGDKFVPTEQEQLAFFIIKGGIRGLSA
jgi:hypothetical protein